MTNLSSLSAAGASLRGDAALLSDALPAVGAARLHVLIVDDESLIADSVAAILNRNGYEAVARYSGLDAVQYFEERRADIVVTDVMLPDIDGVRLAKAVRALSPDTRVVLFSGNVASPGLLELAMAEGQSFELLSKPVHPAQLLKALRD